MGYTVLPTETVLGKVGLGYLFEDGLMGIGHSTSTSSVDTGALVIVSSVAPSADSGNSSVIITAQPLVFGQLSLNVTLDGLLVGSPIAVTVHRAGCAANATALNGLVCVCSAGYYFHDNGHCFSCPIGTYKPLASNQDEKSCVPRAVLHYPLSFLTNYLVSSSTAKVLSHWHLSKATIHFDFKFIV